MVSLTRLLNKKGEYPSNTGDDFARNKTKQFKNELINDNKFVGIG